MELITKQGLPFTSDGKLYCMRVGKDEECTGLDINRLIQLQKVIIPTDLAHYVVIHQKEKLTKFRCDFPSLTGELLLEADCYILNYPESGVVNLAVEEDILSDNSGSIMSLVSLSIFELANVFTANNLSLNRLPKRELEYMNELQHMNDGLSVFSTEEAFPIINENGTLLGISGTNDSISIDLGQVTNLIYKSCSIVSPGQEDTLILYASLRLNNLNFIGNLWNNTIVKLNLSVEGIEDIDEALRPLILSTRLETCEVNMSAEQFKGLNELFFLPSLYGKCHTVLINVDHGNFTLCIKSDGETGVAHQDKRVEKQRIIGTFIKTDIDYIYLGTEFNSEKKTSSIKLKCQQVYYSNLYRLKQGMQMVDTSIVDKLRAMHKYYLKTYFN